MGAWGGGGGGGGGVRSYFQLFHSVELLPYYLHNLIKSHGLELDRLQLACT